MAKEKDGFLGKSLFYMDPNETENDSLTARWVVTRGEGVEMLHFCGYRYNEQEQGFLVRDEMEAYVLAARENWQRRSINGRMRYEPVKSEIDELPMMLRPYEWLWREAESIATSQGELPAQPKRAQLVQFIEGKRKVIAALKDVNVETAIRETRDDLKAEFATELADMKREILEAVKAGQSPEAAIAANEPSVQKGR